jgi:hypothetical protein
MRTFGIPIPLFDKAGADGGSGGGGDGGGKAPEGKLTDEQRAEIGALVSGALKSEGKRQIAAAVKDAIEGLKLGETIAAEVAKLKPEPTPDPKPGDKKPDPEVSALKAKVEELTTKLTTEAAERAKLAEQSRDKDALATLKTALAPHVRPEALEIAASHLFVAQKRVTYDDKGNPVLTVRKPAFAGGDEEDVAMPITDGVQHWIKSAEGKFFAPAPGGGTDTKGGLGPRRVNTDLNGMPRYDGPATTEAEKIRRASEREVAVRQRFPDLK